MRYPYPLCSANARRPQILRSDAFAVYESAPPACGHHQLLRPYAVTDSRSTLGAQCSHRTLQRSVSRYRARSKERRSRFLHPPRSPETPAHHAAARNQWPCPASCSRCCKYASVCHRPRRGCPPLPAQTANVQSRPRQTVRARPASLQASLRRAYSYLARKSETINLPAPISTARYRAG